MRLVDLFVRLGADTSGMERGMAGAQKALAGFERSTTTAGAGSDKLLASLDENGKRLLELAQKTGGATKGLNELTQVFIRAHGGMEKYTAIVAAMNAESGRTAKVIQVQSSAFSRIDLEAGKGRLAVGRLSTQFGSLAASAAGVHPVLTNIAGVLGGFALGGFVTAGALAGLAAITLAYRHFTEESRKAEKASKELTDELVGAWKARQLLGGLGDQKNLTAQTEKRAALEAKIATLRSAMSRLEEPGRPGEGAIKDLERQARRVEIQRQLNAASKDLANVMQAQWEVQERLADAESDSIRISTEVAAARNKAAVATTSEAKALERLAAALRSMPSIDTAAALGAGATAAFDIERARREREFAPGSEAFKRTVGENQRSREFADTLARRALDPMIDEKPKPGLELGMDMERSLEESRKQTPKLDQIKNAVINSGAIMQAAMIALGDKILVGGGGTGSRTGGFIGGTILGTLGLGGGPLGKAFGTIIGTMAGSAIGGLFDKPKRASDALDKFTSSVIKATEALTNTPAGFKIEPYRYGATSALPPTPITPPIPPGGPTRPIGPRLDTVPMQLSGTFNFYGVTDVPTFQRDLQKYAAAGGSLLVPV